MSKLILINGKPGVGKTTLAAQLKESVAVPILTKDNIKEFLFDTIGYSDREWSKRVGKVSIEMLFTYVDIFLGLGQDIIIENAFWKEFAGPQLAAIIKETHAECLEIYCFTDQKTRMARHDHRMADGSRHSGHDDTLLVLDDTIDDDRYKALEIGEVIMVDTTQLGVPGYAEIINKVKDFLKIEEDHEDDQSN